MVSGGSVKPTRSPRMQKPHDDASLDAGHSDEELQLLSRCGEYEGGDYESDSDVDDDAEQQVLLQSYGYDSFPSYWRDPLGLRDFSPAALQTYCPRVILSLLWVFLCAYCNNLSQAWLQQNLAGWYEARWQTGSGNFSESQEWLQRNSPGIYKQRWGDIQPSETAAVFAQQNNKRYTSETEMYQNKTLVLFDLVFLYLPRVNSTAPAEFFSSWPGNIVVIRYLFFPGPLSMRWQIFYRGLFLEGVLFLLRAVTTILTPLPNPYRQCDPVIMYPKNVWLEAWAINVPFNPAYDELTCQDVLYSGHTVMGTLGMLFFAYYAKKAPVAAWCRYFPYRLFYLSCFLFTVWGWYVIAASHYHYSVDVWVGAVLTVMVFTFYHTSLRLIATTSLGSKRGCDPYYLLRIYEGPASDIVFMRNLEIRSARHVENEATNRTFSSSGEP